MALRELAGSCTGSPMSSTNTSPPSPSEPARMMSCTASGIVMK